jgi:glutathione reductase (NADPH)
VESAVRDFDVDLFVIGAGSGGVRAARIASSYGARVAIAEQYRVGGTCVIRGCVPKKLLVYAARFADEFKDAAGYGWTAPGVSFDWQQLIANKDKEIGRLEAAYTETLDNSNVEIIKSRAVLQDANTVRLAATGITLRAKNILIATGSVPSFGRRIPGVEHVISSDDAFHLQKMPRGILIQGGGYIAVEFAGIFAALGSEVIVVYRGQNILRGFDDDIRQHLLKELRARGITVILETSVTAVEKSEHGTSVHLSDGTRRLVDTVMFAIGRTPNVQGLGLEAAGVAVGPDGGIVVDAFSRTSAPDVYAVGDVTNRINLTPIAIRDGHALADTLFGGKPTAVDHSYLATAVFSEPEIGCVGMTEAEAVGQFANIDVYSTSFRPMKGTLSGRSSRSFMKIVVDAESDTVVGCHIAGPGAAELIQAVAIAVKMRAKKADFDRTIAVHPTAAEELVTMHRKSSSYRQQAAE